MQAEDSLPGAIVFANGTPALPYWD